MSFTYQPYCNLSDVKLALDPAYASVSPDDAFINTLISQAQADLDSEIGYGFYQDGTLISPATRTYDGTGDTYLWIDDLLSMATCIETSKNTYLSNGAIWVSGTVTTTDITADVILKPNNFASIGQPANKLVRNSGGYFAEGNQNYTVTGVFGEPILPGQLYSGVPNDVTRACIRLTVHYFKMRDTNYASEMQERGGIRQKYTIDWPDDVKRIVNKYAHTRFYTR